MVGRFCSDCGEKRLESGDLTVRHFCEQTLEAFTNVDGKVFRTLKALLFEPGRLTADYLRGCRKQYIAPLQIFLIANLIFFLLHPILPSAIFTTPLRIQRQQRPFAPLVRAMVERKLAANGMAYQQYETQLDSRTEIEAKSLVIGLVPMVSVPIALLYWRRRRHFLEHLVFSLHFCAFLMLCAIVVTSFGRGGMLLLKLCGVAFSHHAIELGVSALFLAILGIYLYGAMRRVFGGSAWKSAVKAVSVALMMFPVVFVYRFTLFLVGYWMT
jgi:hypothetical protein